MRKSLALLTASICLAACGLTLARDRSPAPHRFSMHANDRGLVQVQSPVDGKTWAAWAYRNGAEFDLAVSVTDSAGFWTEPMFVGLDDGIDQVDPALAVDEAGTVYLAFVDRGSGVIVLTALRHGAQAWSTPVAVSDSTTRGRAPSMAVVGNRLVVGYRVGGEVQIVDLPLLPPPSTSSPSHGLGINDGPDPTGVVDGSDNDGRSDGDRPPPLRLPRDDPDN